MTVVRVDFKSRRIIPADTAEPDALEPPRARRPYNEEYLARMGLRDGAPSDTEPAA